MFCPECGHQNIDDAKFCQKCGKKFLPEATMSSSSPPVFQTSSQQPSSSVGDSVKYVSTEPKDSGTVTVMSVIGFVFGLIGMLGSFIPCIGALAFFIGIPAAIISAIGLGIAYSQNAKKTFAIVAVTISLIGVAVSGFQYFSIMGAGNEAKRLLDQYRKELEPTPTPTPVPAPETPAAPESAPAAPAAPEEPAVNVNNSAIEATIRNYYQSVQDKRFEDAINAYSVEKRPKLNIDLIVRIGKDTEYYKIDSIDVTSNDGIHALATVRLRHKKYNNYEENWEIYVSLVNENENGIWKLVSTPGRKL